MIHAAEISYTFKAVCADDLATQGAKAYASMALTYFALCFPSSAPDGLIVTKLAC